MPDQQSFLPPAEESLRRLAELLGVPGRASAPDRAPRPTDAVWNGLVAAVRWQPEPRDRGACTRFGKCVNELHAMGATASSIAERAGRYRSTYPTMPLTPEALVKHWSAMAPPLTPASQARPASEDEGTIERDGEVISIADWKARLAAAGAQHLEDQTDAAVAIRKIQEIMGGFGAIPSAPRGISDRPSG